MRWRQGSEPRRPDTPFWVEPDSVEGGTLYLSAEESHHLLHVLRAVPGAAFEAVDGLGRLYLCELARIERTTAVARVLAVHREVGELPGALDLIVGLPDFPSCEALVTRAVPLGVRRIAFAPMAQSERWRVTATRKERLLRLARAAVKQTRRTRLPDIEFPDALRGALREEATDAGVRVLADAAGRSWSEEARAGVLQNATLAVGPPGGLSKEERDFLLESGFALISLGSNRLRTEDAACALLALAREGILARSSGGH